MLLKNIPTLVLAIFSCVLLSECKQIYEARQAVRKFPDDFLFGASTAAYQVEGAWNVDGRTESIWDRLSHAQPCVVDNCDTGDIANDSYNKYKRDVEMLRELGVQVYRFSLSWTRILPTGFPDQINEAGVQYYNNLINELLKYNITPIVTIYHWDLPQHLQDLGGWANPLIVDWFSDYVRVVYEKFGDRVQHWMTINEPISICHYGYGIEYLAPLVNSQGFGEYLCNKNILLAHANAYHIYDKEFRPSQGGKVGLAIISHWYEPETEDDVEGAELMFQFTTGMYAHPIFSKTGDWPPTVKERVAAKSAAQGFARSRLPDLTPEEITLIQGTYDFYGANHYTTEIVHGGAAPDGYYNVPSFEDDVGIMKYQPEEWMTAASSWLKYNPAGFYKHLMRIKEDYNNPPIFITENGFSTLEGLEDDERITYYRGYLGAVLDAIEDGANIKIYSPWSLMDNFEWTRGYRERFGLYEVDYTSPERTRTPRKSAFVYKEIVRTRSLDPNYEPDTTAMTIDEGH